MKKLKKIMVLFTAALFCMLPIFRNTLTAHAEETATYYIRYVEADDEWRYQKGTWAENGYHRELYYMLQEMKDGDILVVDGAGGLLLDVGVSLSNLTYRGTTQAVVTAKSIDNFYAIDDSVGAVNGNVTNAYVYDKCVCNFNNNVTNLEVASQKENLFATVAVAGTVNHLKASDKNVLHYEFYNFATNTLRIEEGVLTTDKANYSETPSAAATPSTPPAPSAGSANSGEYDDVPKTSDITISPLWFVGFAVLCLVGRYELNKR